MKKYFLVLLSLGLLLPGCKPTADQIAIPVQQTLEAIPTQTAFPTLTALPTYTPLPTQTPWIIIVTPTFTATPMFTPTNTIVPTSTQPPTSTPSPLKKDKKPGFYLVGIDIAPGVWRSLGSSDSCYWSITDRYGNIINNHFGMAGGTMYIPTQSYQVQLDADCGTWTFLQEP